jgi:hypothetical protein
MLRLKEFVASIKMAQACGERNARHFDHDANSVSGPDVPATLPTDQRAAVHQVMSTKQAGVSGAPLRPHVDPVTGELLYQE